MGNTPISTTRRVAFPAFAGLLLAVLACTCGPLETLRQFSETASAVGSEVSSLATQAGVAVPTLQVQATQLAATAQAAGVSVDDLVGTASALSEGSALTGGELSQWAASASATSQFGDRGWSAMQAVGPPNTLFCGDMDTAWASATSNGIDTLTLTYGVSVMPTRLVVYESYNPGAVVRIALVDEAGTEHTVYQAQSAAVSTCPNPLAIAVSTVRERVNTVLITVDQSAHPGWDEIDAVELIGIR